MIIIILLQIVTKPAWLLYYRKFSHKEDGFEPNLGCCLSWSTQNGKQRTWMDNWTLLVIHLLCGAFFSFYPFRIDALGSSVLTTLNILLYWLSPATVHCLLNVGRQKKKVDGRIPKTLAQRSIKLAFFRATLINQVRRYIEKRNQLLLQLLQPTASPLAFPSTASRRCITPVISRKSCQIRFLNSFITHVKFIKRGTLIFLLAPLLDSWLRLMGRRGWWTCGRMGCDQRQRWMDDGRS